MTNIEKLKAFMDRGMPAKSIDAVYKSLPYLLAVAEAAYDPHLNVNTVERFHAIGEDRLEALDRLRAKVVEMEAVRLA